MKLVRERFCWALDLEKHGMNRMYIRGASTISYNKIYSININVRSLIKFIVLQNGDTFGVNYLRSILEKKDD